MKNISAYQQTTAVYMQYKKAKKGGKLKKKVRKYDTIKQNVDSILRQLKQTERGKEAQRQNSFNKH